MSNEIYSHANSKGVTYFLNCKDITLRGGRLQRIYFFSKDSRADTGCALPADKEVGENPRNGFLTVKKKV